MSKNIMRSIQGNENTTRLINELKNSSNRYPTLNKEEEQQMISKYRNNREKLNELLILHNMKIVFNLAKKYANRTNDFDGMVQDGMLGLAEAAKRFDLDLGIKFITYAHVWVQKYILSSFYAKNIEVDKNSTSLNSMSFSDKDGDSIEFEDYVNEYLEPTYGIQNNVVNEISNIEQSEICNDLYNQLKCDTNLSVIDKNVFIDLYCNREKTIDVAEKYDLTREQVISIKHKVLNKFKNILAADYGITRYSDMI